MGTELNRSSHVWFPATTAGIALALVLGACAPLATDPPTGFDMSGQWVLDAGSSDETPDIDAIRQREDRQLVRGEPATAAASATYVVQDFPVLAATRLRIEQDADSMGVYYDEGTYRDVSWGDRTRDLWAVSAGWADGALVVRSTRGAIRGEEVFTLEGGGLLRIAVSIHAGDERFRVHRVYRRR